MRYLFAVIALAVALFALAGCGDKTSSATDADSVKPDTDTEQPDTQQPDISQPDADATPPDTDMTTEEPEEVQPDADGIEQPDNSALVEAHHSACYGTGGPLFLNADDGEVSDDDVLYTTDFPDPVVNGDQVTVEHLRSRYQCCIGGIAMTLGYGDSTFVIRLYEKEILGGDCLCMCHYDVSWTFMVDQPGIYTIEIYKSEVYTQPVLIKTHTVEVTL